MKVVFLCPGCFNKLRIPLFKHIRFRCKTCGKGISSNYGKIISETGTVVKLDPSYDFLGNMGFRVNSICVLFQKKIHKVPYRSLLKIGGLVLAFLLTIVSYQLTQAERWAFETLETSPTLESIDKYLSKEHSNKYKTKATFLKDSILFQNAVATYKKSCLIGICNCNPIAELVDAKISFQAQKLNEHYEKCILQFASENKTFQSLNEYQRIFPKGQFLDSILYLQEERWLDISLQYEQVQKGKNTSRKGIVFFHSLLDHIRQTKQPVIYVAFKDKTVLKDWDDYPRSVHKKIDEHYRLYNDIAQNGFPLPSLSPPPSITMALKDNHNHLHSRIIIALQSRLDKIFNPNPFQLEITTDFDKSSQTSFIQIDYTIKNNSYVSETNQDVPLLISFIRPFEEEPMVTESTPQLWNSMTTKKKPLEDLSSIKIDLERIPELTNSLKESTKLPEETKANEKGEFVDYLFSTEIDWLVKFTIPNSDKHFDFPGTSIPSNIEKAHNATEGYLHIVEAAFRDCEEQLSGKLGLVKN